MSFQPVVRTDERGSVTTEMVLVTPLLLVMLLFIVFAGRMAAADGRVVDASRDAARAASIARSPGAARSAADAAAQRVLAGKKLSCAGLDVATDTSNFQPGGEVRVTIRCRLALQDLSLLGIPGSRTFTQTSVEVVDRYRSGS